MKYLMLTIAIISSILMFSCSEGIISELPRDNIKINSSYQSIQAEIFDNYCISCHAGEFSSGGLDLTHEKSYQNLVNKDNSSATKKYIIPGNSEESYLIRRLTDNSQIMPPTGALDQYLIDTLKTWINNGALNN